MTSAPSNPDDFRNQLFNAQEVTPALRNAYQQQLDALRYEPRSPKNRALAITLLVICLAVVAGEIRAMLVYHGDPSFYIAAATMLAACAVVAAIILRDLFRPRVERTSAFKVSELFYGASWLLVTVQCLKTLSAPADPASTYGILFLLVFAFVCTNWSFANRITAAELAAKEQSLRLECRLADLAERLPSPKP